MIVRLERVFDPKGLAAIADASKAQLKTYNSLSGCGATPQESLRKIYCDDFLFVRLALHKSALALGWTTYQKNVAIGLLKEECDALYGLPSLVEMTQDAAADWEAFLLSEFIGQERRSNGASQPKRL